MASTPSDERGRRRRKESDEGGGIWRDLNPAQR